MINKISIQNFQNHKDTVLEFDKGMNVIVGPSDSGKTAIIRAFKWLIQNRPGGEAFRSTWGGNTLVQLKINNDTIIRKKSKQKNTYEMNKVLFEAFGTGIPQEIEEALNMDEINLQQQLDLPFLLAETSGNVALHFNKVAKLDKIDRGLQNVQKELTKITQNVTHTKIEIDSKKESLKEFENLPQFEIDLQKIEKKQQTLKEIKKKKTDLSHIFEKIERIERKIIEKSKVFLMEKSIDAILGNIEKKKTFESAHNTLKKLALKIYYTQKNIKTNVKTILAEKDINKILNTYEKVAKHKTSRIKIQYICTCIEKNKTKQDEMKTNLKKLEKEYKRDFPDICPLCDSKIK